eukprot:1366039-Lingulodinium_polyedra.AAC.1
MEVRELQRTGLQEVAEEVCEELAEQARGELPELPELAVQARANGELETQKKAMEKELMSTQGDTGEN